MSRTKAEQVAERTLRHGGLLRPPISLPFRVLARTCPACGDLVTTPPGRLRKASGPPPVCRRCNAVKMAKWYRARREAGVQGDDRFTVAAQEESLDRVRRHHVEWTGPELEIARRVDLTSREVATMLGRTLYAVQVMRGRLRREPVKDRLAGVAS